MIKLTMKFIVGFIGFLTIMQAAAQAPLPPKPYELNALLIDLSGSMGVLSQAEPTKTRLELGMAAVEADINTQRLGRRAAIYTFNSGIGLQEIVSFSSAQALDPNQILTELQTIETTAVTTGTTPFAQAYCDVVNFLKAEASRLGWAPIEVDLKITLATDGLENATPSTHECHGTNGLNVDPLEPWTVDGSWQYKVKNKGETGNPSVPGHPSAPATIITNVNYLFDSFVMSFSLSSFSAINDEIDFYTAQASDSGGYIRTISKSSDLPVAGDVNGDHCVDIDDYNILLQNYGTSGAFNVAGDLNNDRSVNFDDYGTLLQFWGTGHGC
jgi:hypothetical protein